MPKPLPEPTPETQPFWDGAARGELRIQRCVTTGRYFFYPRLYSPFVIDGPVEWVTVSGDATLYSYNISHVPIPGFLDEVPYAIAVVQLAEGPRMMTNIVGIPNTPENLVLDMPLKVAFQQREGITVPVFTPAGVAA
ncbi:OB-fold domain-containing protein [Rhodococcus sp. T2V]|uniref:Zn-ribbon domain-containing OB-fold protein n=1 Tax=Rhodococcus sp. T2V TaxID=3034164 RepID=UPI0023E0E69B|nr:OB-fold domain-containing protein [Rhodococcus sp. T2V]MDF3311150.1 OB-fold domain-containing protein [Rhodococcus sp. T2V]